MEVNKHDSQQERKGGGKLDLSVFTIFLKNSGHQDYFLGGSGLVKQVCFFSFVRWSDVGSRV